MKTLFSKSVKGRNAHIFAESPRDETMLPKELRRKAAPELPQSSELDIVRHFTNLSKQNFSVDTNFYPLGSCTMKYNPKFTEYIAGLPGFSALHPLTAQFEAGVANCQGSLECIWDMEQLLCEITGMEAYTMQPMAGANGEFTGIMLIAAYHKDKGNTHKKKIICPDSAHGTNPATAILAGYEVVNVVSKDGIVDLEALDAILTDDVAGMMMTCPNTLGLFETFLPQIVEKLRKIDALLYYDGANMNAIMGKLNIGNAGFDVVHWNVHKTLATPHGGGGPGSGPVGVSKRLAPYLPTPHVEKKADGSFFLNYNIPKSMGYIAPFYGNFGVMLKAYAYVLRLGVKGITRASEYAVLNANYLKKLLENSLTIPYKRICAHEFVASAPEGMRALDIAKALLDNGYHAPTVYFPLIVKECLMFEPTETESKETLDGFATVIAAIVAEGKKDPEALLQYPHTTPVRRLDETAAARNMILTD